MLDIPAASLWPVLQAAMGWLAGTLTLRVTHFPIRKEGRSSVTMPHSARNAETSHRYQLCHTSPFDPTSAQHTHTSFQSIPGPRQQQGRHSESTWHSPFLAGTKVVTEAGCHGWLLAIVKLSLPTQVWGQRPTCGSTSNELLGAPGKDKFA